MPDEEAQYELIGNQALLLKEEYTWMARAILQV
jgi:hypothetical protein